jgi:thermitase
LLVVLALTVGASVGEAKPKPPFERSTMLVKFSVPSQAAGAVARLGDVLAGFTGNQVAIVKLQRGEKVERKIAAYEALPGVTYAEPNFLVRAALAPPNDPSYGSQWNLAKIHELAGWSVYPGSYVARSVVKLGVVDTGVDSAHEDLNDGRVLVDLGANCLRGMCSADSALDDNGHGTHVAGIAAAETNNGTGVAGVGYPVEVIPVKVLGADGVGSYAALSSGIVWAAEHGARVLNVSISGSAFSRTLCDAVAQASSLGSLVVAAAGNNGTSASAYPAACPGTIGVSATDSADGLAAFSSFGYPNVFVSAPGVSITSTYLRNTYRQLSGTSMATPHVAGLSALIFSQVPGRTPEDVKTLLATTSDKVGGGYGSDPYGTCTSCTWSASWGYGRVNAERALGAAAASSDYVLRGAPSVRSIRAGEETFYDVGVDAFNGFTGTVHLSVDGVPIGATTAFSASDVTGSGSSRLTVSTSALTLPGSYRLRVTGTSGVMVRTTSVILAVSVLPVPLPSSGFTLTATPPSRSVAAGTPAHYAVVITPLGMFSEPVVLSVSGLPSGATALFAPPIASVPGASVLTVQTQHTTPMGLYPLSISASSGSIVQSATAVLQIT